MKHLQKIPYKILFSVLILAVAGIVFFLKIGSKTDKISAAWWNDGWYYRKAINIENSSGSDLTDFQVSISVGTSELIANNKMQSDCDDIRILDKDGQILPHWIEENNPGCNSPDGDTKIWIKASSFPASDSTIYLYYGNNSTNNVENGNDVFLEFDDFNNSSTIDNWIQESNPVTTFSISNGIMTSTASSGDYSSIIFGESYTDITINSRFRINASQSHGGFLFRGQTTAADNAYQWVMRRNTSDNRIQQRNGGSQSYLISEQALPSTLTADNWFPVEIRLSGTEVDTYFDNQQSINGSFSDTDYNSGKVGFLSYDGIQDYDYIFVRKYASTQPISTLQSEELSPAPIAYWKFDEGVGTTAYDSTSTKINGTISTGTSSPTWTFEDQCISEKCLTLYGTNSYIDIGTSLNYLFTDQNFTIESWINPARLDGSDVTNYEIFGNESYNNYGILFRLNIHGTPGSLIFRTSQSGSVQTTSSTKITTTNTWYHVAAVRNGSSVRIYINGVDSTTSAGDHINPVLSPITASISGGQSFNGKMDEVKIYPYARSADQIKLDYNSRGSSKGSSTNLGVKSNNSPSLSSKLVAYYKFDENNGTIANNSINSGIGLSGIFGTGNSAPTWTNDGKFNKALNFGGNNYLTITDNNNILDFGTNDFAISFYTYRTDTGYQGGSYIGKGSHTNGFNSYDNKFRVNTVNGELAHVSLNATTNKWEHHLLIVTQNSTPYIKHYINGNLDNTGYVGVGNTGTYGSDSTSDLIIGKSSAGGINRFFNGLIDEIKIYNSTLTNDEINQDYNQSSSVVFGSTNQTIGNTTTSLNYCIPGDTSHCASPVAEWKIEKGIGTSIVDTSGNNKNGTFNNSPYWVQGKIGKALSFNPSNNNSITTTFNSQLTNYTAEAWVKPNSLGSGINNTVMAASSSYPLWFTITNGEVRAYAFTNSTSVFGETNGANIEINKWYHIAVSATQNGTATIYVNGVGQTSFTAGNISWPSGSVITIGDLRNDRNLNFNGSIDHVKIYDYARTPAQVAYDYNKGAPIAHWKLNECQGNTANDSSGNSNNGTITIGASGSQDSLGTCQIGTSAAWTNGSTGKINSSLSFDGTDDYIEIENDLGVFEELTISAWIKTTSTKSQGNTIMSNIYDFGSGWQGILLNIGRNTAGRVAYYAGGWRESTSSSYNSGQWVHVLITHNSAGIIKFYKNAVLDGTITGATLTSSSSPLFIGYERSGAPRCFDGQIDDVRIYNYPLTSEQIKQVYNGGAVNFR